MLIAVAVIAGTAADIPLISKIELHRNSAYGKARRSLTVSYNCLDSLIMYKVIKNIGRNL